MTALPEVAKGCPLRVERQSSDIESLAAAVNSLATVESSGARLLDLWVWQSENGNVLNCLSGEGRELVWRTVDLGNRSTYVSVGPVVPAAQWLERDIARTSTVNPQASHPHPSVLHGDPAGAATGRGTFTIPFGPVRSGVVESMLYDVVTAGEDMVLVSTIPGFKARNIEAALCSAPLDQSILIAERIAGVYSVAGALLVAQAIEYASGTCVSFEAAAVRTVLAELERIFNHCDSLMKLCDDASLSVGVAQMGILKERILRLLASLTGHRFGRGVVDLGGVRRGIDPGVLRGDLERFQREYGRVRRLLMSTGSFLDRLQRTGALSRGDAALLGASGPVARGSHLFWDARAERPYAAYGRFPVTAAAKVDCDAMARTEVRLNEIDASIDLCRRIADDVPLDRMPPREAVRPEPGQYAVATVEAPEGEWIACIEVGGTSLARCRIRPASLLNFACFPRACEGWVLTDFAFIEHSFHLSIAGRDR